MNPGWVTAVVGLVVMIGQAVNVWLTLKLKTELQTSRQEILDRVAQEYKRQDVCAAEMHALVRPESARAA